MKPKNKKRKIWLYVMLTFGLIILAGAGYIFYELKIKQYDVADPVIDELIEEEFVIDLPDGKQLVLDKDGKIIEEKSGSASNVGGTETEPASENASNANEQVNDSVSDSNGETAIQSENAQSEGTSNLSGQKNSTKPVNEEKPTVSSIKEKYMPTLEALQVQANSKVDGLVGKAYSEYVAKKQNGQEVSFGYFYNKYVGAADTLEASTDAVFNSIISIIESELVANGFNKDHANSLRDEYNAQKEQRRSALMNKALEAL
nr:hypothetical protein [Lysinibacillus timonensis]